MDVGGSGKVPVPPALTWYRRLSACRSSSRRIPATCTPSPRATTMTLRRPPWTHSSVFPNAAEPTTTNHTEVSPSSLEVRSPNGGASRWMDLRETRLPASSSSQGRPLPWAGGPSPPHSQPSLTPSLTLPPPSFHFSFLLQPLSHTRHPAFLKRKFSGLKPHCIVTAPSPAG